METNKDYTTTFKNFGEITIPKGTILTHITAMGKDERYHFVNEFGWIEKQYPQFANILKMDAEYYGIDIPVEFVEKRLTDES